MAVRFGAAGSRRNSFRLRRRRLRRPVRLRFDSGDDGDERVKQRLFAHRLEQHVGQDRPGRPASAPSEPAGLASKMHCTRSWLSTSCRRNSAPPSASISSSQITSGMTAARKSCRSARASSAGVGHGAAVHAPAVQLLDERLAQARVGHGDDRLQKNQAGKTAFDGGLRRHGKRQFKPEGRAWRRTCCGRRSGRPSARRFSARWRGRGPCRRISATTTCPPARTAGTIF